jgi:hypothetical protein
VQLNKLPSSVVINIKEIRGYVEATGGKIDVLIFIIPSSPLWPLCSNTMYFEGEFCRTAVN